MTYGLKFFTEYVDRYGTTWRDEIAEKNHKKFPVELKEYAPDPIVIDYTGGTGKNEMGPGIYASKTRTRILNSATLRLESFYSDDPKRFKRTIYKDGSVFWQGWLVTDLLEEPVKTREFMTLEAADGLGDLKDVNFVPPSGFLVGPATAQDIIRAALKQTGLELDLWVADHVFETRMNTSQNPLSQLLINYLAYLTNKEDFEPAWTVLEELCVLRSAQLLQVNGVWMFRRISLLNGSSISYYRQKFDGTALSDVQIDPSRPVVVKSNPDLATETILMNYDQVRRLKRSVKQLRLKMPYGEPIDYAREFQVSGWYISEQFKVPLSNWEATPGFTYGPGGLASKLFEELTVIVPGRFDKDKDFGGGAGKDPYTLRTKYFSTGTASRVRLTMQFRLKNLGGTKISIYTYYDTGLTSDSAYINENGEYVKDKPYTIRHDAEYFEDSANLNALTYRNEWETIDIEFRTMGKVQVSIGRGYDTDIKRIKDLDQFQKQIEYRFLKLEAVPGEDDKAEVFEIKQKKEYGDTQDDISVRIGDSRKKIYYGATMLLDGRFTEKWSRLGMGESRSQLDIAALEQLSARRVPAYLIRGSFLTAVLGMANTMKVPVLFPNKTFRPIELSGNNRGGNYTFNFVQCLVGDPAHSATQYTEQSNGELRVISSSDYEGNVVDTEADLRITFLELNGKNGKKLTVTGSVLAGIGGSFPTDAFDAYLAFWDQNEEGPYTVRVYTPANGEGILDFEKVYENVTTLDLLIEVPGPLGDVDVTVVVEVKNAAGAVARRRITTTADNKLIFAEPTSACSFPSPVLIGNLGNSYVPTLDKITGRVTRKAQYTLQVVNLITGEVVEGTDGLLITSSVGTAWFEVKLPEEWKTGRYGVRVKGKSLKGLSGFVTEYCGIIMEIKRCKQTNPRWFGGRFGGRFKKKEVLP